MSSDVPANFALHNLEQSVIVHPPTASANCIFIKMEEGVLKEQGESQPYNTQFIDQHMYNFDEKQVRSETDDTERLVDCGSQQCEFDINADKTYFRAPLTASSQVSSSIFDSLIKKEEIEVEYVDNSIKSEEVSEEHVDAKHWVVNDEQPQNIYSSRSDAGLLLDVFKQERIPVNSLNRNKHKGKINTIKTCDNNSTLLKSTIKIHRTFPVSTSMYECGTCSYQTSVKRVLIRHVNIHIAYDSDINRTCSVKEKPYATCNYSYADDFQFKCEICNYKTTKKRRLVQHNKTHRDEKTLKCEICEYTTLRKNALIQHVISHTGSKKPFICEICNYRTSNKGHFVRHIKTHKSKKCEMCEYSASSKVTLLRHMRTHTGENTLQCEFCDYRPRWKSNLARHITIHTGEKQFKCKICDYRTSQKGGLLSHTKTHTSLKPFKCGLCEYRSLDNSFMLEHIKNCTGEMPV